MLLPNTSRRAFLGASGSVLSGAWLLGLEPLLEASAAYAQRALQERLPFTFLTEGEAADFEAFSARIIPTDETPGAREAGAVYFADRVLDELMPELRPVIREGLAAMNRRVAVDFPGTDAFADLPEDGQDRIVTAVEQEDPGFFFVGRLLVVLAMVTHPEWGGNRDKVGWQLMGFQDHFVHQPPFGYYDRDEHGAPGQEDA